MCKGLTFSVAKRFKLSILKLIRRKAQRKKKDIQCLEKKENFQKIYAKK